MVHFGRGFPGGAGDKEPACQCRRQKRCGFDFWVRKIPGGGNGNPLQYSCLENSMHGEAWEFTVHGVANNQTLLNLFREHARFGRECGGFLQRSQGPAKAILEIQGRCSRTQKHNHNRGRKRRDMSDWPSLSLNRSRPGMRSRRGEIVNVAPKSDFSRN